MRTAPSPTPRARSALERPDHHVATHRLGRERPGEWAAAVAGSPRPLRRVCCAGPTRTARCGGGWLSGRRPGRGRWQSRRRSRARREDGAGPTRSRRADALLPVRQDLGTPVSPARRAFASHDRSPPAARCGVRENIGDRPGSQPKRQKQCPSDPPSVAATALVPVDGPDLGGCRPRIGLAGQAARHVAVVAEYTGHTDWTTTTPRTSTGLTARRRRSRIPTPEARPLILGGCRRPGSCSMESGRERRGAARQGDNRNGRCAQAGAPFYLKKRPST